MTKKYPTKEKISTDLEQIGIVRVRKIGRDQETDQSLGRTRRPPILKLTNSFHLFLIQWQTNSIHLFLIQWETNNIHLFLIQWLTNSIHLLLIRRGKWILLKWNSFPLKWNSISLKWIVAKNNISYSLLISNIRLAMHAYDCLWEVFWKKKRYLNYKILLNEYKQNFCAQNYPQDNTDESQKKEMIVYCGEAFLTVSCRPVVVSLNSVFSPTELSEYQEPVSTVVH